MQNLNMKIILTSLQMTWFVNVTFWTEFHHARQRKNLSCTVSTPNPAFYFVISKKKRFTVSLPEHLTASFLILRKHFCNRNQTHWFQTFHVFAQKKHESQQTDHNTFQTLNTFRDHCLNKFSKKYLLFMSHIYTDLSF